MLFKVYALFCPLEKIVRYIGVTERDANERLREHLIENDNPYKKNWIQKLKRNGAKPEIKILFESEKKDVVLDLEKRFIKIFKLLSGKKITNIDAGGSLPPNWLGKKHSDKTRKIFSIPVIQMGKDGKIISNYYGIGKASEMTGIDKKNIEKCCGKKRKTAGGYIWRYKK